MADFISGMVGLIFSFAWVMVIVSIVKIAMKNAKNNQNQNQNGQGNNSSNYYQPAQQQPAGTSVYGQSAVPRPVQTPAAQRQAAPQRPATAVPAARSVADRDGDGKVSTTEYLAQKAREDEAEHRKDDYLTRQKLTQGGTLQLGLRIPDDGRIPAGMHIEYCSYCGAENVLANHQNPKAFRCYFCHEQLQ